jgi:NADPH:quinone reductase-like Zn-dependent oxidoreductase
MLSNEWIVEKFYPIAYIPNGVRLTAYGGESVDLPAAILRRYLDKIAAGKLKFAPARVYTLDEIRQAHDDMEHDRVAGKMVVRLSEPT